LVTIVEAAPKPQNSTALTPAFLILVELGRHVGVAGAVGLVRLDLEAALGGELLGVRDARLVEAARAADQPDRRDALLAHVLVDLADRHAVGVRGLEHPLLHRVDDHRGAGQRDERQPGLLDHLDHRHGLAGGGAPDQRIDLVLLDQALDEGGRVTFMPVS
jgi:hypothetical protein